MFILDLRLRKMMSFFPTRKSLLGVLRRENLKTPGYLAEIPLVKPGRQNSWLCTWRLIKSNQESPGQAIKNILIHHTQFCVLGQSRNKRLSCGKQLKAASKTHQF